MHKLRCGLITLEPLTGGLIAPVAEGFSQNGCAVQILHRDMEWQLKDFDFLVTYGPMQSMVWAVHRLSQSDRIPPLVVWYTEQVPSPQPGAAITLGARARYLFESIPFRHPSLRWLFDKPPFSTVMLRGGRLRALGEMLALRSQGMLKLICVFSETNASFFRHYQLPVSVIPMGYHPHFGERLADVERDIDVVFLGSTRDDRRRSLIPELEQKMGDRGIRFVIKDGSPKHGHVFGADRTLLLNRAKIMLNIMRQPWDDPVFRLLLAAPAGAMLISENLLQTAMGPFQPGVHFAMADLDSMIETIREYLSADPARIRITDQAYEFVTGELTMQNMAKKVLKNLEGS